MPAGGQLAGAKAKLESILPVSPPIPEEEGSSGAPVGAIVGGIVAGIAVAAALAGGVLYMRRRRRGGQVQHQRPADKVGGGAGTGKASKEAGNR